MDNLIKKIEEIERSSLSDMEKLQNFVNFMANLNPAENYDTLMSACKYGISYSSKLNRPEMEAQFYISRAKILIMQTVGPIGEMKNITLAPNWFQFALESEKRKYNELNEKVKKTWDNVHSDIDKAFETINKNRDLGAVAFCLKTTGEIYGQYYLQIKLYNFQSKFSVFTKIVNNKFFRFLELDDMIFLDKTTRKKLKIVKRDCLVNLNKATAIFKKLKNYDYLADAFIALSVEYNSFNNFIKDKYYLFLAERLIKRYNLKGLEENLSKIKKQRQKY